MNTEEYKLMQIIEYFAHNINSTLDIFVDSMEDAITQANKLQEEGYDLFRGQSGLWPVISNLNRLNEIDREKAKEKALIVENTLRQYNSFEEDQIVALLQHFGLPTNFVDFTTEPAIAAFFTTQISGKEPNEFACIICIQSEEVNAIINIIKKDLPTKPEIINVCMDNLLRQKAQKGKFLFLPFVGFEIGLPYKRIVFKNSQNNASKFNISDYYPDIKSDLECKAETLIQIVNNFRIIM